ncbi:uncharacterized protein LOC128249865 [Octopus bimaculoides]|uniref:uncharacterized protein LOC128249865 n=1 Tax=Octopus bimaculoides TaxID=37653 RepID=UPI0022E8515E|nr:uncharacterized protein LOC128249865 [Octopus bimaculoides]
MNIIIFALVLTFGVAVSDDCNVLAEKRCRLSSKYFHTLRHDVRFCRRLRRNRVCAFKISDECFKYFKFYNHYKCVFHGGADINRNTVRLERLLAFAFVAQLIITK